MEPERPIEKSLRDWAKKRRDAAPDFELHPADRRALQDAVARQFGDQASTVRRSVLDRLSGLWPKVAVAAAVAVIAVLVPVLFLTGRPGNKNQATFAEKRLAMNREAEQLSSLPAKNSPASASGTAREVSGAGVPPVSPGVSPALAPTPEPTRGRDDSLTGGAPAPLTRAPSQKSTDQVALAYSDRLRFEEAAGSLPKTLDNSNRKQDLSTSLATTNALSIAGGPLTNANLSGLAAYASQTNVNGRIHFEGDFVVAGTFSTDKDSSPRTAPSSSSLGVAQRATVSALSESIDGSNKSQTEPVERFFHFQSEPAAAKSEWKSSQPVLTSFELQRAGQQLRIVDADGSVYTGFLQTSDASESQTLADSSKYGLAPSAPVRLRKAKEIAASSGNTNQIYSFRVAGTNRTLNQELVFSGTLGAITNGGVFWQMAVESGRAKTGSTTTGPATRISGKAIVSGTNEIEINAASSGR